MSYGKYGKGIRNTANLLAYQECASLMIGNVFLLTMYVTRILFGPLAPSFAFISTGLLIMLYTSQVLLMAQHNILSFFKVFIDTPNSNIISVVLTLMDYVYGGLISMVVLLSKEHEDNVLYLIFISKEDAKSSSCEDMYITSFQM